MLNTKNFNKKKRIQNFEKRKKYNCKNIILNLRKIVKEVLMQKIQIKKIRTKSKKNLS